MTSRKFRYIFFDHTPASFLLFKAYTVHRRHKIINPLPPKILKSFVDDPLPNHFYFLL